MDVIEAYNAVALEESAKGLQGYLDHLVVDSRPPQRLKKLLKKDKWEAELLNLLLPLFETAAGHRDKTEVRSAYVTAGRGHSKTSILASLCNWALTFAKRPITIVAAAGDKDQAKILIDRCKCEARNNSWLYNKLQFGKYDVLGPKGQLTALSADAPTSSGLLTDMIVIDELTQHSSRELHDILLSGRDKRPTGCLVIISNAGIVGSWQHQQWLLAKQSPNWVTYEVPPMSASWLDKESIEEQRQTLPPSLYKRLHLNIWANPGEQNAFVTPQQLGPVMNGRESLGDKENAYTISVDYGMTQDRTALCIMHAEEDCIILDKLECWQGNQSSHVQIERIEAWLLQTMQDFRVVKIVLDAFQLEGTAQKFEKRVHVERVNFGGNTYTKLSENLRSLILNRKIRLYKGAGPVPMPGKMEDLEDELLALEIIEKGYGWRFEHSLGGHDDRTVVLAMGALTLAKARPIEPMIFLCEDESKNELIESIGWR